MIEVKVKREVWRRDFEKQGERERRREGMEQDDLPVKHEMTTSLTWSQFCGDTLLPEQ